jgi:hypothetical protein
MDIKKYARNNKGNVVISGVMVFIVTVIMLYVGLTIIAGVAGAIPTQTGQMLGAQNNLTAGVGQGFNLMSLSPLVIAASVILGALFAGLFVKSSM